MSELYVLRSEWDGVIELVFNRPEKLNALTRSMFAAVRSAVDDLRTRPDLRVLLIRSTGRYFSAGVDLTERDGGAVDSASAARTYMRVDMHGGMHALYEEMERVEKPIVVAHHAMCVGGSLEMSLSCDFRLAAKSAGYWFPELDFGMLPLSNGVGRLTRLCGGHWARWMILAGEKVSADQALMMGLVHKVYEDETFEEEVRAFCRKIAAFPAEAVAAGKLAVEMAEDLPADQARQMERLAFSSLALAPEQRERQRAIRQRLGGE